MEIVEIRIFHRNFVILSLGTSLDKFIEIIDRKGKPNLVLEIAHVMSPIAKVAKFYLGKKRKGCINGGNDILIINGV